MAETKEQLLDQMRLIEQMRQIELQKTPLPETPPPPADVYAATRQGRIGEFLKERFRLFAEDSDFRNYILQESAKKFTPIGIGILTAGSNIPTQVMSQMVGESTLRMLGIKDKQRPDDTALDVIKRNAPEIIATGALEFAGDVGPAAVFKGLQSVIKHSTAGGRRLLRRQAIDTATELIQGEKEQAEGLLRDVRQTARQADLGTQISQRQRAGLISGAQKRLTSQAARLQTATEGLQEAVQTRLGRIDADTVNRLARRFTDLGDQATDDAIDAGYQLVDDLAGNERIIPRDAIDDAVASLVPEVRRGLRTVLSVIPRKPKIPDIDVGIEPPPITELSFTKLREIQRVIGRTIRVLERSIARGEDINAPSRLPALQRVYAATHQALEDAASAGDLNSEALEALLDANKLNAVKSTFDRLETLRATKATPIRGGVPIFDADAYLKAIQSDAYLVRRLKEFGTYDGLTGTLSRIANAQKMRLPKPEAVGRSLSFRHKELGRQEALKKSARQLEIHGLQGRVESQMRTLDQSLENVLKGIDRDLPEKSPLGATLSVATPISAGITLGYLTKSRQAGIAAALGFGGASAISKYIMTPQGQRHLEQLFATDPYVTMPKLGALFNLYTADSKRSDLMPPPIR